jgi:membrane protein implicated in regulation of membrane protease activity
MIVISVFILFLVGAIVVFLIQLLFDIAVILAPIIVLGSLTFLVLWYAYSEVRKERKSNEHIRRNGSGRQS